MNTSKVQKIVLGLMLTAIVKPTTAMDAFRRALVEHAGVNTRNATSEDVMHTLTNPSLMAEAKTVAKDETIELSEIVQEHKQGSSAREAVENAGCGNTPLLLGLALTPQDATQEHKDVSKMLKRVGIEVHGPAEQVYYNAALDMKNDPTYANDLNNPNEIQAYLQFKVANPLVVPTKHDTDPLLLDEADNVQFTQFLGRTPTQKDWANYRAAEVAFGAALANVDDYNEYVSLNRTLNKYSEQADWDRQQHLKALNKPTTKAAHDEDARLEAVLHARTTADDYTRDEWLKALHNVAAPTLAHHQEDIRLTGVVGHAADEEDYARDARLHGILHAIPNQDQHLADKHLAEILKADPAQEDHDDGTFDLAMELVAMPAYKNGFSADVFDTLMGYKENNRINPNEQQMLKAVEHKGEIRDFIIWDIQRGVHAGAHNYITGAVLKVNELNDGHGVATLALTKVMDDAHIYLPGQEADMNGRINAGTVKVPTVQITGIHGAAAVQDNDLIAVSGLRAGGNPNDVRLENPFRK